MKSPESKRIRTLIIIFTAIIIIGSVGYKIIEGYSFLDSLFFTIISITTVGYQTIGTLSDAGKIFTILLLMSSFVIIAFIVDNFSKSLINGDFRRIIRLRKIKRIMKNIKNHIIVCGYGSVGSHAVSELYNYGKKIVVIEQNDNIDDIDIKEKDVILIKGNATKEETLKEARIDKAEALISTLNNDADNLLAVITAKDLNPNIKIISRAVQDTTDRKLKHVGADYVILPDSVGGVRMAKLAVEPNVIEFMENILAKSGISVRLTEINCEEIKTELKGKTIKDLNIRKLSGANVVGFCTKEGEYIFNPTAGTELKEGSKLFVLGTPEQVENLKNLIIK